MKSTRRHLTTYTLAIIIPVWVVSTGVFAAEIEGTVFEEEHYYKDIRMRLTGTALLRYLRFIKAYTGAFYIQEDVRAGDALKDVPKLLILEYRYAISADDFAEATTKIIRQNVEETVYEGLSARIQQLNDMYRSVQPGDRYSLCYIPGHGTELALNGVSLGVVPGADFAYAVFSIWIGKEPIDETFRDTLLGV